MEQKNVYLNLDSDIKKHLNIDVDFRDDDQYLLSLYDVACNLVEKHIDKSLADLEDDGDLPAGLKHAILLTIANMYDNRESVAYASATEVPKSLQWILDLYQNYSD